MNFDWEENNTFEQDISLVIPYTDISVHSCNELGNLSQTC